MKSFDIEKIGKKMPYSAPSAEFFESFTQYTMARIDRESRGRSLVRGAFISVASMAASVALMLTMNLPSDSTNYSLASYDSDLDAYVTNLSDDELSTLFYDMELEGEFYSNL